MSGEKKGINPVKCMWICWHQPVTGVGINTSVLPGVTTVSWSSPLIHSSCQAAVDPDDNAALGTGPGQTRGS